MLWVRDLRRAACLLSLCLLTQSHLRPAYAAPLSRAGEEEGGPPDKTPAHGTDLGGASREAAGEDLFPDVDPEALAAVLLQALQAGGKAELGDPRPKSPGRSVDEEGVRSEARSSDGQPEREPAWEAAQEGGQAPREPDNSGRPAEVERLKALLRQLQRYGPAKREERPRGGGGDDDDDGEQEEEALEEAYQLPRAKAAAKRRAPPLPPPAGPAEAAAAGEPWSGARKLRQQQHLEHQLLQRRYEELAESRRQAEEARRAAAEEERLADMASDLLLQYLLKDGEEEAEEGEAEAEEEEEGHSRRRAGGLLFEDEEANVAEEDKRSNEAPESDEEIDPSTIDRLIELSSKLHLPAGDVVDLIQDAEEKKRAKDVPQPRAKAGIALAPRPPPLSPRSKPKKAPAPAPAPPPLLLPPYAVSGPALYRPPPARQPYRPKPEEAAWNEILKGDEYPAPKWPSRAQAGVHKISNAISPRTFRPAAYTRYRPLPGPLVPRGQAGDVELENYLESVLGKDPERFQ